MINNILSHSQTKYQLLTATVRKVHVVDRKCQVNVLSPLLQLTPVTSPGFGIPHLAVKVTTPGMGQEIFNGDGRVEHLRKFILHNNFTAWRDDVLDQIKNQSSKYVRASSDRGQGIRKGKKFINHVAITLPDLSRHICRTGDEKEREE